jgi:hypothetical protein
VAVGVIGVFGLFFGLMLSGSNPITGIPLAVAGLGVFVYSLLYGFIGARSLYSEVEDLSWKALKAAYEQSKK